MLVSGDQGAHLLRVAPALGDFHERRGLGIGLGADPRENILHGLGRFHFARGVGQQSRVVGVIPPQHGHETLVMRLHGLPVPLLFRAFRPGRALALFKNVLRPVLRSKRPVFCQTAHGCSRLQANPPAPVPQPQG